MNSSKMVDLAFVKQHNMVAYLEKTKENADFHQILDFLTSSSINFALTISPTIYALYIEQFWNTACLKTINSEKQIHANVDGKVVVVLESSVRRDLHLNDEDGTACLTTNAIFENLALMGYEPASDKLTFYKVATVAASQPPKDLNTNRRTKRGWNTKVPQFGGSPNKVGDEAINEEMFDSVERAATTASSLEAEHASGGHTLRSGEDSMEHQIKLTNNVPNTPHDSPLRGVNTPGSNEGSLELTELMDLVTKPSHMVLDLEKVKTAQAKEIVVDEGMAFVQDKDAENQGKIGVDDTEVVKGSGDAEVNTAGKGVSTANVSKTMKEEKAKDKGVVLKDVEDSSRHEIESVEKTKKKVQGDAQVERDAEVALRLQAELDEELKVKREIQDEASKVAIAEMLLAEFFERRKKQLAAERAEAIRNKPPTKTLLRNLMMTYLKNMGGYKHSKRLKRVAGSYATQKSPKKSKVMKSAKDVIEEEAAEYEKEKEELRLSLKIIPNDDSEVDYEPLSRKFPIMNWEY
ncbi:hypothetical protein Tco_0860776 [Tanacetum coccineum]|uniref:Xylulose kinase-1 n=1 Tax=Tanacetum coccineum TaxID=301880 RepID=A0ABQ5BLL0_9ASTR